MQLHNEDTLTAKKCEPNLQNIYFFAIELFFLKQLLILTGDKCL